MKCGCLSQQQRLVQAPAISAGVFGLLLPVIEKYALFGPTVALFGPPNRLRKETSGEKVGKFMALRLELG